MKEENVLIVATTSYAGMGPYVSEIVNDFLPEDNVYFLFRDYEDEFFYRNIKKELHSKSVFVKIPNTRWNTLVDLLFNRDRLKKYIIKICAEKSIDIVHYINTPASEEIILCLKKKGVNVVSTVHDLQPHEAKKEWYKMLRHKIFYSRLGDNVNKGHNLITNSLSQFKKLKQLYPQKSVFYHPFPSLVTDLVRKGNDVPAELKDLHTPFILFFGRIEEYKGLSLLYNVFASTPELYQRYSLVVAGKGTNTTIRSNQENHVLFLNRYIQDTEVAHLFKNAKVVVYPYISATQSGVLTLAFYFGTPILASDVPFFKEMIEGGKNGMLFQNGDENDLKKVLMNILNSDTSDMTRFEKDYYSEHYTKGAQRSALLDIYRQLI